MLENENEKIKTVNQMKIIVDSSEICLSFGTVKMYYRMLIKVSYSL